MLGISFSEILLILVISLIIFGPEQLPVIAKKAGKLFSSLKNLTQNVQSQLYENSGLAQVHSFKSELEEHLRQIKGQFTSQQSQLVDYVSESEILYHEFQFLYQPELDFDRQPELFDER